MKQSKKYYARSVYLTIAVYFGIIFILFVSIRSARLLVSNTNPNAKIVQAVTVNQNQVTAEIQKIKAEEQAKKTAELNRQKKLAAQALQAKQQRIQEEKRLSALKVEQQKLAAAKQAAEAKAKADLAAMQQKKAQMEKQLAEVQKQQAIAKQKQALTPPAPTAKTTLAKPSTTQTTSDLEKSLQNQISTEEQQISATRSTVIQSEVDKYKALILNTIGQQWIMPANVNKNLSLQLMIHLAPGGTVLDVSILQSSGDAVLDRSVLTAVWKASPLPVPADLELFDQFRELHLTVRPEGLLNGTS